jgi:hypothetical protein
MLSVLSCGVAMVAAHGFTIYPPARNSIDKDLPMFGPGAAFALTAQALACQMSSRMSGQIHALIDAVNVCGIVDDTPIGVQAIAHCVDSSLSFARASVAPC